MPSPRVAAVALCKQWLFFLKGQERPKKLLVSVRKKADGKQATAEHGNKRLTFLKFLR
jgi:hypothetical protein